MHSPKKELRDPGSLVIVTSEVTSWADDVMLDVAHARALRRKVRRASRPVRRKGVPEDIAWTRDHQAELGIAASGVVHDGAALENAQPGVAVLVGSAADNRTAEAHLNSDTVVVTGGRRPHHAAWAGKDAPAVSLRDRVFDYDHTVAQDDAIIPVVDNPHPNDQEFHTSLAAK